MEVVLPDGEILRTGMGGMSNPHNWLVYPHSCGPSWDGMFSQSNYGIVTKMGVSLFHPPEVYAPGWFMLDNEEHFGTFLETLRPLMIDGTIPNQPMIINAVCAASAFGERKQWYDGADSIPEAVLDKIAATPGFGRWVMRFALYGRCAGGGAQPRQDRKGLHRHSGRLGPVRAHSMGATCRSSRTRITACRRAFPRWRSTR